MLHSHILHVLRPHLLPWLKWGGTCVIAPLISNLTCMLKNEHLQDVLVQKLSGSVVPMVKEKIVYNEQERPSTEAPLSYLIECTSISASPCSSPWGLNPLTSTDNHPKPHYWRARRRQSRQLPTASTQSSQLEQLTSTSPWICVCVYSAPLWLSGAIVTTAPSRLQWESQRFNRAPNLLMYSVFIQIIKNVIQKVTCDVITCHHCAFLPE